MRAAELARRIAALALCASGCAHPAGPPAIAMGTPCASCGMEVRDARFACERRAAGGWRVYDSIECLLRDTGAGPADAAFLPDYDHPALHAADSLWVVRGEFASPMGGGFAAFLDLAAADSVAAATHGRVDRWSAFMAGAEAGR